MGVLPMKNGRLQAKDVSDEEICQALRTTRGMNGAPNWSSLWDVQRALPQYPPRVVLAKLSAMIRRKRITGCDCGCRGDFSLLEDGVCSGCGWKGRGNRDQACPGCRTYGRHIVIDTEASR